MIWRLVNEQRPKRKKTAERERDGQISGNFRSNYLQRCRSESQEAVSDNPRQNRQ